MVEREEIFHILFSAVPLTRHCSFVVSFLYLYKLSLRKHTHFMFTPSLEVLFIECLSQHPLFFSSLSDRDYVIAVFFTLSNTSFRLFILSINRNSLKIQYVSSRCNRWRRSHWSIHCTCPIGSCSQS